MFVVDNKIHLFMDYVKQHIAESTPTAESIAQEIHTSRSTLFRIVERELGMTPFQYIRQAKLNKAKELLESGQYSGVKEVAKSVGYSRTDYFALIYKEAFGVEVKDYFD